MAVCNWTLLKELWDALGDWIDGDSSGAVSSISPAGELYLDMRALTVDSGIAGRNKDIGTVGTGDYTVYIRFKGDVWDGNAIRLLVSAGTSHLFVFISNDYDASNGVWIYNGASWVRVITKTWDNGWHTLRFDVHNSQTDVDIYVDDEASPSVTDADCSYPNAGDDGNVQILGHGSIAGNGEYHIDYIKINAGLCDPAAVAAGGNPMFFNGGIAIG